MMTDYSIKVINDKRFELIDNQNKRLGYLDYHEGLTKLFLDFVFVEPAHRGEQVGVEIVREGMKLAKEKDLIAEPICGYAATIMSRHRWPEEFEE